MSEWFDLHFFRLLEKKYSLRSLRSSDGTNVINVASRAGKGAGMTCTIESIMKNVPGGRFHFEIAVILGNAYIILSMLLSSETWYDVTESELGKLEPIDEKLMYKNPAYGRHQLSRPIRP